MIHFSKNFLLMAAAALTVFGFDACTDKSTEEDEYSAMVVTALSNEQDGIYFLDDDSTTTYWPSISVSFPDSLIGHRCYVEYSYLTTGTGYSFNMNLTYAHFVHEDEAQICNSENEISALGTETIEPVWAWISGHYLNVLFDYYGSSLREHRYALACNAAATEVGDSVLAVSLCHHLNGDDAKALLSDVASFDLQTLDLAARNIKQLSVKYTDFDGNECAVAVDVPTALSRQNVPPIKHRR